MLVSAEQVLLPRQLLFESRLRQVLQQGPPLRAAPESSTPTSEPAMQQGPPLRAVPVSSTPTSEPALQLGPPLRAAAPEFQPRASIQGLPPGAAVQRRVQEPPAGMIAPMRPAGARPQTRVLRRGEKPPSGHVTPNSRGTGALHGPLSQETALLEVLQRHCKWLASKGNFDMTQVRHLLGLLEQSNILHLYCPVFMWIPLGTCPVCLHSRTCACSHSASLQECC